MPALIRHDEWLVQLSQRSFEFIGVNCRQHGQLSFYLCMGLE
jgi:hypothetical protein